MHVKDFYMAKRTCNATCLDAYEYVTACASFTVDYNAAKIAAG